jgi:hypothetical protein
MFQCEPNSKTTKNSDSNKYQLKHLSVQPIFQRPILVLPNKRISRIVVDTVLSKHQNSIEVLFLATETNTVLKYMLLNLDDAISNINGKDVHPMMCHLEEIEIFGSNFKGRLNLINNLVLFDNLYEKTNNHISEKSILIATSVNFLKMPVANCRAQTNYFSCLSLMDPYCIWDSKAQKCIFIFNTNETIYNSKPNSAYNSFKSISQNIRLNSHLHQHSINSCPSTNIPGKIFFMRNDFNK